MLEIVCSCGWSGQAETRDELLERVKAHVGELHPEEPRDESLLRAMIVKMARPVEEPPSG